MLRICPDCSVAMEEEQIEDLAGAAVNVCNLCGGVWVHPETLTEILSHDHEGLGDLDRKIHIAGNESRSQHVTGISLRHCPDCEMPLSNYHYCYNSPITLQVCSDCGGFWIERGQLTKMQEWLDESRQPATKAEKERVEEAIFAFDHEDYLARQAHLTTLFNGLKTYRPGWQGLVAL